MVPREREREGRWPPTVSCGLHVISWAHNPEVPHVHLESLGDGVVDMNLHVTLERPLTGFLHQAIIGAAMATTIPVSVTGRIVSGMAEGDLIRIEPIDDDSFLSLVFDPPEIGNDGFDYWAADLEEAARYLEVYGCVVDWSPTPTS